MVVASHYGLCPPSIRNSSRSINGLTRWGYSSGYINVMEIIRRWSIPNWAASLFRRICVDGSHLRWLPFLFCFQGSLWRNLLHIAWWWSLRFYIDRWWKCNIRLDIWFIWNAIPLKNYVVIIIDFACIRIIRRYWFLILRVLAMFLANILLLVEQIWYFNNSWIRPDVIFTFFNIFHFGILSLEY